jgi:hypothetical protein
MPAPTSEVQHVDKNRHQAFQTNPTKASRTSESSTVGFIYEVPTNLQTNPRCLLLNLSSLERKVRMDNARYVLER